MGMFSWAICNIAIIVSFTMLALHFGKWWIVLFAAFFVFSYKNKDDDKLKEG